MTSSPGAEGDWTCGGLPGLRGAAGRLCWIQEAGTAAGLDSDLSAGAFCGCAGHRDSGLVHLGGIVLGTLHLCRKPEEKPALLVGYVCVFHPNVRKCPLEEGWGSAR